ncbi:11072_t:CDS:1 [Entrophospora sp. SA101]|nr:11072_t:CDS:1 [Entrophospora sp. SA101]CAJ0915538.1 2104_t:CDS:1 [Entrophospora sp. SA101]
MPLFVIPQSSTSYNEEYGLMHQTACVLCALKNKLANLKKWYEDFQHKIPKITATSSSQLHFPYINFITIKGETFELTYNQELPSHHLVFEATAQNIASSRDIKVTIKFTKKDSRESCNLSEKIENAPKLENHFDWYMTIKDFSEACFEHNIKVQA